PDFKAQKSALQELVVKSHHKFELYPKFHCEMNFIERFWGRAKREARMQCDYSFTSLERRLPSILDSVPLPMIQRFASKAWAYMEFYAEGTIVGPEHDKLLKKLQKQYISHRRVGRHE
ncbi:hypothetical protein BJV82DRAFT_522793, partial [Fennellomyces sp. T-0311]